MTKQKRRSPKRSKALTASAIRAIKEPGRYGDGGHGSNGLYLRVHGMSNGRLSKTFNQRVTIHGRRTNIAIGRWPATTIAKAREAALMNRLAVDRGEDLMGTGIPTFAEAAEKVIEERSPFWTDPRMALQWRQRLNDYAFPHIGAKRVDLISTADVIMILRPVWTKPGVARPLHSHIGKVLRWCIGKGYRRDDPTGKPVTDSLPPPAKTNRLKAAPPAAVPGILKAVNESTSQAAAKLLIQFVAVTAVRVNEAAGARWKEFDLEGKVWTIPAARMKTKRQHTVPLSSRAIEVLSEARKLAIGKPAIVFVNPQTRKQVTSASSAALLRKLKVGTTVHGFRTSFRTWAAEAGVDRQTAELALAHAVPGIEGIYQRSDLLEHRRKVMEDWGRLHHTVTRPEPSPLPSPGGLPGLGWTPRLALSSFVQPSPGKRQTPD